MSIVQMAASEVREWIGWGIAALIGLLTVLTKERHFFNARVDARIKDGVRPELIHDSLSRIEEGQKTMETRLSALDVKVDSLSVEVGFLKGIREGRREYVERKAPDRLTIIGD